MANTEHEQKTEDYLSDICDMLRNIETLLTDIRDAR